MSRILVVEDERDLADLLDYNLRHAGHEVAVCGTGRDALERAREQRPDLVVLDLMLPDMPGTDVCRALRAAPETRGVPIIVASARKDEIDRVLAFELGADDYVTKPYSMRELTLRIGRILDRRAPARVADVVEVGVLRFDRDAHRAWVGARELGLTVIEFRLLVTLYDRRGRIQSRAALLRDVWQDRSGTASRTVDTHVRRLREKLGEAAEYVRTERGLGYSFVEQSSSDGK
jgi:two-component system phosphate regulon response regulator PhoB